MFAESRLSAADEPDYFDLVTRLDKRLAPRWFARDLAIELDRHSRGVNLPEKAVTGRAKAPLGRSAGHRSGRTGMSTGG